MFEFFFKYPWTVFQKGRLVLLGGAPWWVLLALVAAGSAALGGQVWLRFRAGKLGVSRWRAAALWLLEGSLIALLLALLWRPAISIATLKPQQNIVAVLVDDSRSMSIREGDQTRLEQATGTLRDGLLAGLQKKLQVRLYGFGKDLQRIEKVEELSGKAPASRLGESLKAVAGEAASLPIGAVVLLSDGSDNTGGIDLATIAEIRRHRIPVHAVGFGRDRAERDLELEEAVLPSRALADSRLSAAVTFRQQGYEKQKARLVVRESGKALASQEITLQGDGARQNETILFNAGLAGPKNLVISIDPLEGEANRANNTLTRLLNVESRKPRLLYMEGEPRWEMKFIRRAAEQDRSLQLASLLRTTQNRTYRQGMTHPKELEEGFPAKPEELFAFQGLILGSVEAAYFTPAQQELMRQFVDQRGGGLLFLAGRSALAEGGYAGSRLAELLPVTLPGRKGTFMREEAGVALTAVGRASILCRLEEHAQENAERWSKLPALAELIPASRQRLPLLVVQNYGRGRTAVLATSGDWRWQMLQDLTDQSHEMFWQQLLRWLVAEAPGQVSGTTPRAVLPDETRVALRAEVQDRSFRPVSDARVEARILGPGGSAAVVELNPAPQEPGRYSVEWAAEKPGSYLAEIVARRGEEEVGRDVLMFLREDGVAENFRTEQNRELLMQLAEQSGGRYWRPEQASRLADEISYSEAGITVRETRDLWDMPVVFLLALALRAAEWLLRRKWGVV